LMLRLSLLCLRICWRSSGGRWSGYGNGAHSIGRGGVG
jgi:hypothetical protein